MTYSPEYKSFEDDITKHEPHKCGRLIVKMSKQYGHPKEKIEGHIRTYRRAKKEWKHDWEGELAHFAWAVRFCFKHRHDQCSHPPPYADWPDGSQWCNKCGRCVEGAPEI